jgi:hypothetical protein
VAAVLSLEAGMVLTTGAAGVLLAAGAGSLVEGVFTVPAPDPIPALPLPLPVFSLFPVPVPEATGAD